MSEYLALDREDFNEMLAQAREIAERRFSPGDDRCPRCDTKVDDEDSGLCLLFDWEHVQPGDVSWDGELWTPCRRCNWKDGRPVRVPKGAIVMGGYYYHIEQFIEAQKGEKLP